MTAFIHAHSGLMSLAKAFKFYRNITTMPVSKDRFISELAQKIRSAYKKRDARKLKKVYHQCLNELVIEFDYHIFRLALISYMLTKLVTKPRYWRSESIRRYLSRIDSAFNQVIRGGIRHDYQKISKGLDRILELVNSLDAEDQRYVNSLVEGGKVKIAATLYAKGLSLSRVADLTRVDKHKILSYVGKTTMADKVESGITMQMRLNKLRRMLD